MDIISHRLRTKPGQSGNRRENLIALSCMGITWIETDVFWDESGKILVHHPGKIKPDVDVMDFKNLLSIMSSLPRMNCLLDVKCDSEQKGSEELVRKIVKTIIYCNLQNRFYITAFQKKNRLFGIESDGELLLLAKRIDPKIKTHVIVTWPSNLEKIAKRYRADAISFGWLLEPGVVRIVSKARFKILAKTRNLKKQIFEVKETGIKVWAGIANDEESMKYFADLGVDGIMTDNPSVAIALRKKGDPSGQNKG